MLIQACGVTGVAVTPGVKLDHEQVDYDSIIDEIYGREVAGGSARW